MAFVFRLSVRYVRWNDECYQVTISSVYVQWHKQDEIFYHLRRCDKIHPNPDVSAIPLLSDNTHSRKELAFIIIHWNLMSPTSGTLSIQICPLVFLSPSTSSVYTWKNLCFCPACIGFSWQPRQVLPSPSQQTFNTCQEFLSKLCSENGIISTL